MDKLALVTDEPGESLRVSVKDYVANLMERYRHIFLELQQEKFLLSVVYRAVSRMAEEAQEAERNSTSVTAEPNDSHRKSVEVYVAKLMER